MKIFVSHSLKDKDLIHEIKNTLEPLGITLLIAEHHNDLNKTITSKIESLIWQCDVGLILLTKNGYKSKFVQQEIGYVKSCNKPILQVVQSGLENKISGFLYGRDFIVYDPENPQIATQKIKRSLVTYWQQVKQKRIEEQQRHFHKIKMDNDKKANEAKLALGVFAGLLILVAGSK
jgi:hypothetical protein